MMQDVQWFELSPWIRSSYSLESPLDSTAIYPKTKTLSRANLSLRIPLELDDNDLDRTKMERLS